MLEILGILMAIGVGLGCGSYATMPYYRLPNNIACAGKWVGKKSACPSCGHQLRTRDLLPVFNWLLTRGKCAFCKSPVNPVYFFIESTITLLSVLLYLRFGPDQLYIISLTLAVCLVILVATEWTYAVLPNQVLGVMVMMGAVWSTLRDGQIYDMINVFVIAVLMGLATASFIEKRGKTFSYSHLRLYAASALWLNHAQFMVFTALFLLILGIFAVLGFRKGRPHAAIALAISLLTLMFEPGLADLASQLLAGQAG